MISETPTNKAIKGKNLSESDANPIIIEKRKIMGHHKRNLTCLNKENLRACVVKKMDPKILYFDGHLPGDYLVDNWSEQHLQTLANVIKSATKTQELEINLQRCQNLTDKGLSFVSSSLRRLKSLKKITIHFPYPNSLKMTSKAIYNFCQALKGIPSLKSVNLDFSGCKWLRFRSFLCIAKMLKKARLFQDLRLNFSQIEIANKGLVNLGQGLKYQKSLKRFIFLLEECKGITSEGLKSLRKGFKKMAFLQDLVLNFSKSCLENDRIRYVGKAFKNLTSLKSLTLDFGKSYSITGEEISLLNKGIKTLSSLKHLHLDFSRCLFMKDKCFVPLEECLKSLRPLESLFLNFRGCVDLSDEGMQNFMQVLSSFPSLENQDVIFIRSWEMTEKGVSSFGFFYQSRCRRLNIK